MIKSEVSGEATELTVGLQQALFDFANADCEQREAAFTAIASMSESAMDPEIVAQTCRQSPGRQDYLEQAIAIADQSTFVLADNSDLRPWSGGYSVVALSLDGTLLGAINKPQGRAYDIFGANQLPRVLFKAVQHLHFKLDGDETGIETEQNYNKISWQLGFNPSFGATSAGDGQTVIAVAGCSFTEDYLEDSMGEKLAFRSHYPFDVLSQQADRAFAGEIALAWYDLDPEPHRRSEPVYFQRIRETRAEE